jgi:hypothetical protein
MNADSTAAVSEIAARIRRVILEETYERAAPIRILAHYTSVDAFASILRSKEMWFSCVRDTNDTREVSEGFDAVEAALAECGSALAALPE